MISDEVQMLINRMKSNPEEFRQEIVGIDDSKTMAMKKWTILMNGIVNNRPSLEIIFTPEELKALKQATTEMLRPEALATIVKTIVGGDDTETNIQKLLNAKRQMEMNYNSQEDTGKI